MRLQRLVPHAAALVGGPGGDLLRVGCRAPAPPEGPLSASTEPLYLTGHCYCGAIRYAVDLPAGDAPIFTAWCHCDSCRRAHAAPLYQVACVEASTFRLTAGEELLQEFAKQDGGILRAFCGRCGTRMLNRFPAWKPKGKVAVAFFPNTLDAPLQHPFAPPLRPVHHAHVDECVLDAVVLEAMSRSS